ncbi:SRPBCC family protein [Marinilabiliaceae bacterium JC017]|nr:SRPBCC family protein [Marinilabiliaceae bacterium JC017]
MSKLNVYIAVFICLMVGSFGGQRIQAQMAAATPVAPTLTKGVVLNSSIDEVWRVISQPENYAGYANGVTNFVCNGSGRGAKMSFSVAGDPQRKQEVSVLKKDEYLITFFVTTSDYMSDSWVYRFLLGKEGEGTYLRYEAYFSHEEDKAVKQAMKKSIEKEWQQIAAGLQKKFN